MRSTKKIYRTKEGIRKHCSHSSIPSCEREILLILTVILFVFSQNSAKRYSKYQNESTTKKNNIIKPNIISSKLCEPSASKNNIKKSDIVPNKTYDDLAEKHSRSKRNYIPGFLSGTNQFEKVTKYNDLHQHDSISDKHHDKEIDYTLMPVMTNKHPEEISKNNDFVKNSIMSKNNSNSLNIYNEETCSKTLIPIGATLKKDYRGVMICAMLPNGITISGEVAFNFNDVVALKYNNTIIFINENYIISFY